MIVVVVGRCEPTRNRNMLVAYLLLLLLLLLLLSLSFSPLSIVVCVRKKVYTYIAQCAQWKRKLTGCVGMLLLDYCDLLDAGGRWCGLSVHLG